MAYNNNRYVHPHSAYLLGLGGPAHSLVLPTNNLPSLASMQPSTAACLMEPVAFCPTRARQISKPMLASVDGQTIVRLAFNKQKHKAQLFNRVISKLSTDLHMC
jgi:hypothetical protein